MSTTTTNPRIYFDSAGFSNHCSKIEFVRNEFKDLINKYKKLGLRAIDTEDMKEIIVSPEEFYLKLINKGKLPKFAGIVIDAKKGIEMMDTKPDGLISFISTAYKLQDQYKHYGHYFIIRENVIVTSQNKLKSDEGRFGVYASTPSEKKLYDLTQKVAEAMSELYSNFRLRDIYGLSPEINEFIEWTGTRFRADKNFIKTRSNSAGKTIN